MENYQLTIDDYLNYKENLQRELNNMVNGFIRTGYYLKKIRDAEAFRNDGYSSIYEFAEKEYGVTRTVASRFMSINDKYSEDGYSLELKEQYKGLGSSRLSEMLTLPEEDHVMITPVTKIEDIRALKRFEKEEVHEESTIADLLKNFFLNQDKKLEAVMMNDNLKDVAEIVNPSGNVSYRYRMDFMMMHEYEKGIDIKNFQTGMHHLEWSDFVEECKKVFVYDPEAAGTVYEQNYGKNEPEEPVVEPVKEDKAEVVEEKEEESRKNNLTESVPQPKDIGTSEEKPISEKTPEIKASEPFTGSVKEEKSQATEQEETKKPQKEAENPVCEVAQTRISSHIDGDSEDIEKEPEIISEEPKHEVVSGEVEDEHIVHLIIPEYQAIADGSKKFLICKNNVQAGDVIVIRVKFNRAFSDIKAKVTYREKNTGLMPEYTAYGIEVVDEEE